MKNTKIPAGIGSCAITFKEFYKYYTNIVDNEFV